MGVNESAVWECYLELVAELADIHVHRAISGTELSAPDASIEILPCDDRALPSGHSAEQFELSHRQRQGATSCQHETLLEPDLQLARIEDVGGYVRALREGRHDAERRRPGGRRRCKLVIQL